MTKRWPPRRGGEKCVIGMVHLLPLPGSAAGADLDRVISQAQEDVAALEAGGADAVLVQNRGDRIFPADQAPPDTVAAMGAVVNAIVSKTSLPVGVHVLRNDVLASIGVAYVAGAQFVRAVVLTGVSPSAQGLLQGNPHAVDRYRRSIGAEDVLLFADVISMHNRTPVEAAEETAHDAVFFGGATALIVADPNPSRVGEIVDVVQSAVDVPVLIGGYATEENVVDLLAKADGVIVGSALERSPREAGVDVEQVREFVRRVRASPP